MNTLSVVIMTAAILVCAFAVLYCRRRAKQIMCRLNRMLDDAIDGKFNETTYDESRLSQVEAKMSRFLSVSKLSRNSTEKERDKIKSLISDISHQTKTPIANIILYAELLSEQKDLSEQARALSEQLRPQAEKLNFLIQSLIKTSRLESGIVTLAPSVNNVSELTFSAVRECLPKAESKNISLRIKESSCDITGFFDLKWTAEALYNIIDNAVKYTENGGTVEVSSTSYEMFVRVDVRDSGIGIHEHEQTKIFERFYRSPTVSQTQGVGIGLFLARQIVAAEGGYIKVRSEYGKGSVFSLFLSKL